MVTKQRTLYGRVSREREPKKERQRRTNDPRKVRILPRMNGERVRKYQSSTSLLGTEQKLCSKHSVY